MLRAMRAGVLLCSMNRGDPSERIWNALKRLAQAEKGAVSSAEAIKRVRAIAKQEGAPELPDNALRFYADEYCEMVRSRVIR